MKIIFSLPEKGLCNPHNLGLEASQRKMGEKEAVVEKEEG